MNLQVSLVPSTFLAPAPVRPASFSPGREEEVGLAKSQCLSVAAFLPFETDLAIWKRAYRVELPAWKNDVIYL